MTDMSRLTTEELAQHAASVRSLAAHLLGDEHLGDDVAQDAAMIALSAPPPRGIAPAAWFRGVARHLSFRRIRTESRRRRRERAVAAPESRREDDPIERTELRQIVVAELLAMEDPYRRAMVLRWFEELSAAEIARREGVPAGTVRSWLSRGAEMLRARLDRRFGDERQAWAVPLTGLLDPPAKGTLRVPRHVPAALGASLMGMKTVALGAVIVAVAGGAWFFSARSGPSERNVTGAGSGAPVPAAPGSAVARVEPDSAGLAAASDVADGVAGAATTRADLWVTGRVVGEGRHPVADVEVVLNAADTPAVSVRTDAVGSFRVPARVDPQGVSSVAGANLHARTADGRAALRNVSLSFDGGDVDAGTLVLGPAAPVEVEVSANDVAAGGVRVVLHDSGRLTTTVTDAEGRARFDSLPHGVYRFEAWSPELGHATEQANVPRSQGPVRLILTRRDIEVRVVAKGSGAPLPGVRVRTWYQDVQPSLGKTVRPYEPSLAMEPTDSRGVVIARGAGRDETVYFTVARPGGAGASEFSGKDRAKPGENAVTIEASAPQELRFPIEGGDAGTPPDGTIVRLIPSGGVREGVPAPEAVIRDGAVVIGETAVERVYCLAVTPDGRIARLNGKPGSTEGAATSFRHGRRIEVRVLDHDGKPVAGRYVVARDQGNNAMRPPVATGDDGVATIRDLFGGLAEVYITSGPRDVWGSVRVGTVDLDRGSAALEHRIQPSVPIRLAFSIDGRPALPTRFNLTGATVVREDPDTGVLDLMANRAADGAPVYVFVSATGFVTEKLEIPPGTAGVVTREVALRRAGSVTFRVAAPADGRMELFLRTWDAAASQWLWWSPGPSITPDGSLHADPSGVVRLDSVPPGRYRLVDNVSRAAGEPFEVSGGETSDLGEFDLSKAGWVNGKVTTSAGTDLAGAIVVPESDDLDVAVWHGSAAGAPVRRDGSFTIRVPGDRPIRLRVTHPLLRAAPGRGTADVSSPRSGVELALERGPVIRLRAPGKMERREFAPRPRVLLFAGEPVGPPIAELHPVVDGSTLRFGAPEAGRFTLWVDVAPWAPVVIRDVQIGAEDIDLGEPKFDPGSTARIRILVKDGESAPRLYASATRSDAPSYTRDTRSDGESELVIRGLVGGRFKLLTILQTDAIAAGHSLPRNKEFEVSGLPGDEVTFDVDLR